MKTLARLVLIAASSILLGAVPAAAPAAFSMNFFGFTGSATSADGTWSANGGIEDVGGFTMSWTVFNQIALFTATLVGKQGSITLSGALRQVATSPTDSELTGPVHLTGRIDHQILRGSCFGKRHYVTDVFRWHQYHHRAFDARSDAAMRRRAVSQGVKEETKARPRRLFSHAERFENDGLHVAPVNSD